MYHLCSVSGSFVSAWFPLFCGHRGHIKLDLRLDPHLYWCYCRRLTIWTEQIPAAHLCSVYLWFLNWYSLSCGFDLLVLSWPDRLRACPLAYLCQLLASCGFILILVNIEFTPFYCSYVFLTQDNITPNSEEDKDFITTTSFTKIMTIFRVLILLVLFICLLWNRSFITHLWPSRDSFIDLSSWFNCNFILQ